MLSQTPTNLEMNQIFKWVPNAEEICVKMLVSIFLPEKLPKIDQFEGSSYQRILIPAKVGEHWVIGNIYEGEIF